MSRYRHRARLSQIKRPSRLSWSSARNAFVLGEAMSAGAGSTNYLVLAVVNDPALRASLQFALEVEGFRVDAFATGEELLRLQVLPTEACLILDHVLPRVDGIAIAKALRQRGIVLPAVLMTADAHTALRQRARTAGMTLVEKPLLGNALAEAIRMALGSRSRI